MEEKEKSQNYLLFEKQYKQALYHKYRVDINKIIITKMSKDKSVIQWLTNDRQFYEKIQKDKLKNFSIKPFFNYFYLSVSGNNFQTLTYNSLKQIKYQRGGLPYYQPKKSVYKCKLNIQSRFQKDKRFPDWISSQNKIGSWAVAYAPLIIPKCFSVKRSMIENQIIQAFQLQKFKNQRYFSYHVDPNKTSQIGSGFYLSPHLQTILKRQVDQPQRKSKHPYQMIVQYRINPQSLKILQSDNTLWIINAIENMRSYGLMFIEQQKIDDYLKNKGKSVQFFTYLKYNELKYKNQCKEEINQKIFKKK